MVSPRGHPYLGHFGHYYGKRSADAEPAADADAHYGGYYGYPLVAAVPRVSTVHGGPLHGLTAVSHGLYAHYGHGLHHPYALAHHGHHGYLGYYGHPYLHHGHPFMDVKCPGCYKIKTVFSHAQVTAVCTGCHMVLCRPTGGKARLTEGCHFRKKQH